MDGKNEYNKNNSKSVVILCTLAKLRKANISFVVPLCLSVSPSVHFLRAIHVIRLPLEGFSLNLIIC